MALHAQHEACFCAAVAFAGTGCCREVLRVNHNPTGSGAGQETLLRASNSALHFPNPAWHETDPDAWLCQAAQLAGALQRDFHYTVDEKQRSILLTEDGYEAAEDVLQARHAHTPRGWSASVTRLQAASRAGWHA